MKFEFADLTVSRGKQLAHEGHVRLEVILENLEILFDRSLGRSGADALIAALKVNRTLKLLKLPQQHFTQHEIVAMDTRVKWSSP